jgi:quercetin dioxygenase-like cupin family protein
VPGDAAIDEIEIVLPCPDLDATVDFFADRLGFRLEMVMPADDPAVAVLSRDGLRVRLDRHYEGAATVRRVAADDHETAVEAPAAASTFERSPARHDWRAGRAGMRYRDLLPERQGGRFVASHISIPDGGPVADYVHHHRIRFQSIYCVRGWVRLVYEDQGPPFVLEAGGCVLQPPGIRHRVLESSPGLEVVEVTSPAEHATFVDHDLDLPTATVDPARSFGGQRFVHHRAATARWQPWRLPGFECREAGIGPATDGLAEVRVVRPTVAGADGARTGEHDAELLFWFVLDGEASLRIGAERAEQLAQGDAVAVPAGQRHALTAWAEGLELLEVSLPG